MQSVVHRVALVLDREFGNKVLVLSDRMHVWMLDSPTNRVAAEEVWAGQREDDPRDPLEHGVTLFKPTMGRTPADIVVEIMGTIFDHHSEWEHSPPMSELEIHGAPDTEAIASALASVGMVVSAREGDSLVCATSPG